MEEFKNSTDIFYSSLRSFGNEFMTDAVNVIGALIVLFILWLIARVISSGVTKLLEFLKFNELAEKVDIQTYLKKGSIDLTPAQLIGKMVYWFFLLVALLATADAMGWEILSKEIGKLLGYLPKLFIALAFFLVGIYIAGFVRDLIRAATASLGLSAGKGLSNVAYYLLLIIVGLTAMQQADIDVSLITSNVLLIIGAILFAAAISYGFASRELLSNILASFYSRKTFRIGQIIELDGVRGEIVKVTNIAVTIQINNEEKMVIPTHHLITNRVKIID